MQTGQKTFDLSSIANDSLRLNIRHLLSVQNVPTCCFDAVLYVHYGVEHKWKNEANMEKEFLCIMNSQFRRLRVSEPLQLGDVICMTYNNETRCQHAFVCLNQTTVFQKSGGGCDHRYEIRLLEDAVIPYSPKLVGFSRLYARQQGRQKIQMSDIRHLDSRVICFRKYDRESCIVL